MHGRLAPFAAVISGLLLVSVANGQAPKVARICEAAWKRARASPEKAKIFASIETHQAPADDELRGEWRAVASSGELRTLVSRIADSGQVALYHEAFVWELPGNSLVVTMFHTSSSGDWEHYVDYCFRANGSLASVESTLTTFYAADGPVRRIRKRNFDANGKQLSVFTRAVDARTGKTLQNAEFRDQDEEIYRTRGTLPFAHPMRSAG